MLGTLERAGAVLDLFDEHRPEWGPSAVATELHMSKSTAFELLRSLAGIGMLEHTSTGRYRLGWRILSLNSSLVRSSYIHSVSRGPMQRLAGALGETIHLAALDRDHVVQIGHITGRLPIPGVPARPGESLPAQLTALGKVLLAFQPRDLVEQMLGGSDQFPDLLKELDRVREDGLAHDINSTVDGLRCVAAPIHDAHGRVVASIALAASARRWGSLSDSYLHAIQQASGDISKNLSRLESRPSAPRQAEQ